MNITCTQDEKERLILAIMNSEYCVFVGETPNCPNDCGKCIEKCVEWEITGGGS